MRIVRRWVRNIAVVCLFACSAGKAPAAELRVTFAELANLVQAVMADATLHLDNKPSGLFGLSSGSYVKIAGKQTAISLPSKSFSLLGSNYAYYVDDLTSDSIKVSAVPSGMRLSLIFPQKEAYLVGGCVSGGCALSDSLPKIVWKNGTVSIDIAPVRYSSSLSLQVRAVTIGGLFGARCGNSGDVFSNGACRLGLAYAKRTIAKMRPEIAASLKSKVNDDAIQSEIAGALKKYLVVGQNGEIAITDVSSGPNSVTVSFSLASAAGG